MCSYTLLSVVTLLAMMSASSGESNVTDATPAANVTDTSKRFGFFGIPGFGDPWHGGPPTNPGFHAPAWGEPGPGDWDSSEEGPNGPGFERYPSGGQGFPNNPPTFPGNHGRPVTGIQGGQGFPNNPPAFPGNQGRPVTGIQGGQGFPNNPPAFPGNQGRPVTGIQGGQEFPGNRPSFPGDQGRPVNSQNRPEFQGQPGNSQNRPEFSNNQGRPNQGRPDGSNLPVTFEGNTGRPGETRPRPSDQNGPGKPRPWNLPTNDNVRPVTEDTFETSPQLPLFITKQNLSEASDPATQEQPTNDFRESFFGTSLRPPRQITNSRRPTTVPSRGPFTFPTGATRSTQSSSQSIPTRRPPRTTSTTVSSMNLPEGTTSMSPCELRCQTTFEFNPVCGTDQNSYSNPARLKCAQRCGKSVTILHYGNCIIPSSTTSEPLPLW